MQIDILTLFPDMFIGPFSQSILKKAQEKSVLAISITDIRDYAHDKHRTVDDYPFGGGSGMLMKPEPIFEAVEDIFQRSGLTSQPKVIMMCPQGRMFNQRIAEELATETHLILICGHYEGIDERVRMHLVDDEISIGDYILTGGELPAMVVVDAISRLVPGVLGDDESAKTESFAEPLLDYPQYTRPREYRGWTVPEVLLSGDHEKVRLWRRKEAIRRTMQKRIDMICLDTMNEEDQGIVKEIQNETRLVGIVVDKA
jgi:tRNA (guanine37-N1)-methyltransferase